MASEPTDGQPLSVDVPGGLAEWLDRRAAELEVPREELVVQLLGAYRVAAGVEDADVEALDRRIRETARDDGGDRRLRALRADLDDDLDDVRRRVVQLKRRVDAKADRDHGHAEFDRREEVAAELDELREDVGALAATVDSLDRPREREPAVPPAVEERLDELEAKLLRVARAVVDLRDREPAGDDALAELRRAAGRAGVEAARCEACGERVRIALLADAACPHCGAALGELRRGSGILDRPRLATSDADDD